MKNTRFFLHSFVIGLMLLSALSAMAFTGPSYSPVEYFPAFADDDYEEGEDPPPPSPEEERVFRRELAAYGWTLTKANEVQPLSSSTAERVLAAYSDAFAQCKPRRTLRLSTEGLYEGWISPLPIFGYVDVVSISAYMTIEAQSADSFDPPFVTGCVLVCRMHGDSSQETGVPAFRKVYHLDTPKTVIQMDAAEYLAEHGKRPFNDVAATDFSGGQRVSEEKQRELSALFPWKNPKYDFLFSESTSPYSQLWGEEYRTLTEPLYAAVYGAHGIPLTEGEVGSLFYDCYYSENIFRSGKNRYAVDFFARKHRGYPNPENPTSGNLPDTWLTWLVVKPLVKNAQGILDRFYYASDTPQSVIAKDMAEYFKDPVNGKSSLAAK